jgi:predicted metal-dependent hydrolase
MARSYTDGEIFTYRGRRLPLRVAVPEGSRPGAALSEDGAELLLRAGPEERRKYLLFFYTARTEETVRALLPAWSKKIGVRPRSAAVKFAKTRWGSCSAAGRLFFNSRLAMLSGEVAEYVVVHELCHLKQMNHSAAFWDCVRSALPCCMALRRKLRLEEREAVL